MWAADKSEGAAPTGQSTHRAAGPGESAEGEPAHRHDMTYD